MLERLANDRRGIIMVFPILFIMLLSLCGMVLDIGRGHIIRGKLQTIADSSSLAAAMTAEVKYDSQFQENYYDEPIYGTVYQDVYVPPAEPDGEGSYITVPVTVITGYRHFLNINQTFVNPRTEITDPQKAKDQAVEAALANSPDWESLGASVENGYNGSSLYPGDTGYAGHVISKSHNYPGILQNSWPGYYSQARVNERMGFLKFLRGQDVPVYSESQSIAILRRDTPGARQGADITYELPLPADLQTIKDQLANDPSSYWDGN